MNPENRRTPQRRCGAGEKTLGIWPEPGSYGAKPCGAHFACAERQYCIAARNSTLAPALIDAGLRVC